MTKTQIMARYIMYTSEDCFHPDYATKILDIVPSEVSIKGQIINKPLGNLIIKENSWCIKTAYEESMSMYNQIHKLTDLLNGKEDLICKVNKEYSTENYFMIVIKVINGECPYIDLEIPFLNLLHKINAYVRFDTYIY